MMAEFLTQRRKDAKAQRVSSLLASLRLRVFALKGLFFIRGTLGYLRFGSFWLRMAALRSLVAVALCALPALAGDTPAPSPSIPNPPLTLNPNLNLNPAAPVATNDLPAPAISWRLLPEARVDSSGVFLNQIISANPPVDLPQIRLAPAPALGQTTFWSRDQVIALARTNVAGMSASNWTGPARVRILRRTRPLGETEMTGLLASALQRDYVKDLGELELHFGRPWTAVTVPDEPLRLTIGEMPAAGVNPNFVAGFDLWNGQERVGHWQAVLQAKVWRETAVAHSTLTRGQLLRDADIVMERRDLLNVRDAILNISKDDNSLALVENVSAGLPVLNRAVRPRPLVKRGQVVDGVFTQGSLTISLKVEILEDGLQGQTIRVRNPKTMRQLYGKVQNEETVRITL
jgi:flagella basal body P-ring formation protein FlgA